MKTCKKCGNVKELSEFYKNKAKPDGHAYICKKCDGERNRIRSKQPKAKATRQRYWRKYCEENKEKIDIYFKQYFREHREEYKKRERAWRARNPERSKELGRKNFQTPSRKIKHKANQAMRRAIKLKATLPGYDNQIKQIYKACPIGYHVDHIIPLRGKEVWGLHVPWNLQYLPALENLKKGNRTIL